MIRPLILLTFALSLLSNLSNAQEICNNNLDDDGDGFVDCLDGECSSKVCEICDNGFDDDADGFVDCYDQECSLNTACKDFFAAPNTCVTSNTSSYPSTGLKLLYKSEPELTNHVSRVLVGDINSDGKTELVTTYSNDPNTGSIPSSKINAFTVSANGSTLGLTTSVDVKLNNLPARLYNDIAMADINRDGCAEMFVVSNNPFTIIAYDCNHNQLWATAVNSSFDPGLIGLADFDQDGFVELYSRTQVFDAHTGKLLGKHSMDDVDTGIHAGINKGWGMNNNAPIAVDILAGNPGLELVAGCRIYSVAIDRGTMSASVTILKELPQYATRTLNLSSNPTSVADYNLDGYLDVLAVGSEGKYDDNTTIFFWDVQNNTSKTYKDFFGMADYKKGWRKGAGRISIADLEGDGTLNAIFMSGKYMYALKEDMTLLWRLPVTDETSGYTGCTTFDFDGDGKSEIVHRDEDHLFLTSMVNGVPFRNPPMNCPSRTHHENPVVADIDGNGTPEICVTCSVTTSPGQSLFMLSEAELRVYGFDKTSQSVRARKVWNQHGYFVTNVNDDLTIPKVQQQPHLIYSTNAACKPGGVSRPLNAFMSQAAAFNAVGCPAFQTADLAFVPFESTKFVDHTPVTCMADSFKVTYKFANHGQLTAFGDMNIGFYEGDPRLHAPLAKRLKIETIKYFDMAVGDTITRTTYLKNDIDAFELYIVLNDAGTSIPVVFPDKVNDILECDYGNFANVQIKWKPVPIESFVTRSNLKCLTAAGVPVPPATGETKAYVIVDEKTDSVNFSFYWSQGILAKPIAAVDYVGATYKGLPAGAYTVYASHKTRSCHSDTTTIVVDEKPSKVEARIIQTKSYNNAEIPNGQLSVVVKNINDNGPGDPIQNFTYSWYSGHHVLVGDTLATSSILGGLSAGTYSVLVSDKATGCYDSAYATVRFEEIILSTDKEAVIKGVSMYPNPGTDGFTMLIDNGYIGDVQLQLLSVSGSEVYKTLGSHKSARTLKIPVDTNRLESGVYLVKISLGKAISHKKWTKV